LCFDVHIVSLHSVPTGIQSQTHRNRIGQTDAILARLHFVGSASMAVALDGKAGDGLLKF